jgi:predicted nucleic acid-binding protein
VSGGSPRATEEWIVDTTPIVILAKIGHLDLLTAMAREVLLPSPVVREIRKGPPADPALRAVEAGWGTEVAVRYIRVAVRSVGLLGPGEQAVLTLALQRPGSRVILDDGQARKAAERLGLRKAGTVGVILSARQRGLIAAVVPVFQAMRTAGCYLDDALLRRSAASVGEVWP